MATKGKMRIRCEGFVAFCAAFIGVRRDKLGMGLPVLLGECYFGLELHLLSRHNLNFITRIPSSSRLLRCASLHFSSF